jgi:hypothetical protein
VGKKEKYKETESEMEEARHGVLYKKQEKQWNKVRIQSQN